MPRMGTSGTSGVLKGRCRSGCRTRSTHTPAQTMVNASSVPIFTSSASRSMGRKAGRWPPRRPPRWSKSTACGTWDEWPRPTWATGRPRHGEEDARLAQQHDQHHGCQPEDRADLDQQRAPTDAGCVDAQRHRIGNIQRLVVHQAGQHGGNQDVEDGADHQRAENADRHILLRILRLLGRGRDGVKADVGEEDRRRARGNAMPSRSCRARPRAE
jgi:hypothetical protein